MSIIPNTMILLPSLDLKDGESMEQALSNLTRLEQHFSKLCSNLDQRLANLKGKLGGMNQRIGTSRQKIDTLKGVNQAITITSPSKFVRSYKNKQDLVYHEAVNTQFVTNQKLPQFNYESGLALNPNYKPSEEETAGRKVQRENIEEEVRRLMKLTKGTIKSKREIFSGPQAIQHQRFEGLGRIPQKIRYLDSMVIFNSRQNPYTKYQQFDNLMSNSNMGVKKKHLREKEKINIEDAPETLVQRERVNQFETTNLGFVPQTKELPMFNAPSQLELHGIVNIQVDNSDFELIPSRGGTVKKVTILDPKFSSEQQNDVLAPSTLSMQRFSIGNPNLDPTQGATPSQANNQNFSQATNNNYSFAPVISQNQNINVSRGGQVQQNNSTAPTPTNSQANQQTQNNTQQPKPQTQAAQPQAQTQQPVDLAKVTSVKELPKATGDRAALLAEINNPNPMARLKKATPKQDGPAKPANPREAMLAEINNPNPMARLKKATPKDQTPLERKGNNPEPKKSHMDHLKEQIALRIQAMNKGKGKKGESDDEDDD